MDHIGMARDVRRYLRPRGKRGHEVQVIFRGVQQEHPTAVFNSEFLCKRCSRVTGHFSGSFEALTRMESQRRERQISHAYATFASTPFFLAISVVRGLLVRFMIRYAPNFHARPRRVSV